MRVAISSALLTAFVLIPGAILGLAVGGIVHETLPWQLSDAINLALSALSAFIGMFVGGAVWGSSISRVTKAAAGVAFLENLVVEQQRGPSLPVHNVFTLLFVSAAAIIAGVSGAALGLGTGDRATAGKLAWMCALAGGCAFLVVNLTMDALGWRVGAPGAAERGTMVTTALLGNLAAAMAGGAIIGSVLWARTRARDRAPNRS